MDVAYRFSSKHLKAIRFRHKSTSHPTLPVCRECWQAWPCDTEDVLARTAELEAENARLQDGYDGLKYQYDEEHDKLLRLQARVEEAEHNLETHLLCYSPYRAELDRYKALAERRKKALEAWRIPETNHFFACGHFHKMETYCDERCELSRAALEEEEK